LEQNIKHSRPGETPAPIRDAIEDLVAEMTRVEPDLAREDAREAIRRTVHHPRTKDRDAPLWTVCGSDTEG
jgi:hypothetical protein